MSKYCLFHSAQTVLVLVFLICSFNSIISSGMSKCYDIILNKQATSITSGNVKDSIKLTNTRQAAPMNDIST